MYIKCNLRRRKGGYHRHAMVVSRLLLPSIKKGAYRAATAATTTPLAFAQVVVSQSTLQPKRKVALGSPRYEKSAS